MGTVRRVLFVSYAFPPVGGAGVQRTTKFVKYLPQFGWEATVLTVANPSVPALDHSLDADLPPGTVVRRARSLEPGYAVKAAVAAGGGRPAGVRGRLRKAVRGLTNAVLQPDPQLLWLPGAVRAGRRLLRDLPHDAIVATGPPFSSFLVGAALSRRSGLPLVLDYRDEWSISNAYLENKQLGLFTRYVHGRLQDRVVRTARALVATTRKSADALDEVRTAAGSAASVSCIYNGFDPADFAGPPPPPAGDRFRLAYIGTLWELTSAAPLVEAVRLLAARSPDLAARIDLVFAGRRTPGQQEILRPLRDLPCTVTEQPYLDHTAAVGLLRSADALAVFLSDLPEAGRVMPAKVFEYLASRRPVLAIAPGGELTELVGRYPAGHPFAPGDVDGIAGWLARAAEGHPRATAPAPAGWDATPFDRRHQAGQLAALLESLPAPRAAPRP